MTRITVSRISSHCHILKIPVFVVFLSKRSLRADLWDSFFHIVLTRLILGFLAANILAFGSVYKFGVVMIISQDDIHDSKHAGCASSHFRVQFLFNFHSG